MSALSRFMDAVTAKECDWCGDITNRSFTDSWTGQELCLTCVSKVAEHVTQSPHEEGDNLKEELELRVGPQCEVDP